MSVQRLLAAVTTAVAVLAAPAPAGWKLAHHSFEKTLTYDDGLVGWLSSAGTMALRDRVQLLPPVADRYGLFWRKQAVKTHDFEISVRFKADVPARSSSTGPSDSDGAFAFWLSRDNFSASYDEQTIVTTSKNWYTGLEQAGLTFLSSKPTFTGLAVVFTDLDATGKKKSAVTAVYNDGTKTETLKAVLEKPEAEDTKKALNWLDKQALVLNVRVNKDGSIRLRLAKDSKDPAAAPEALWNGKFAAGTLPVDQEHSYFGLTGWSGSPEKKTQLSVDIDRIEVRNFDDTKVGEDGLAGLEDVGGAEWMTVLESEKKFINQAAQKDAVDRLTTLLKTHVDRYNSMGNNLKGTLGGLETRLDSLGTDMGVLSTELQAFDPKTHSVNAESVKGHLKGISQILSKDKAHGSHKKIEEIWTMTKDLKDKGVSDLSENGKTMLVDATEQSKVLETRSREGSSQTGMLLVILMIVVAGLGLLFLTRMRYYEKKHYI